MNSVSPDNVADGALIGPNSVTSASVVANATMSGYNGGMFTLSNVGTSNNMVLEGSADNSTWVYIYFSSTATLSQNLVNQSGTVGSFVFNTSFAYVRVRVLTYTSGTVTASLILKRNSPIPGAPIPTGTNVIGGVIPAATSANTITSLTVTRITSGTSGAIKASAGRFYGADVLNTQTTARFLQIYNKTTAGVPGTDTPLITIPIPASGIGGRINDFGVYQATGISWAITTDAAGATVATSGDVVGTTYSV